MSKAEKIISFCCFFLILIHLIASFFPGERLWGISQLHYFPLGFRLVLSAIGVVVLIPQVNKTITALFWGEGNYKIILKIFTRMRERWIKINRHLKYLAISIFSLFIFWALRAKTPLLGDGYLRAGEIKLGQLISITEPVDFYLHLATSRLFGLDGYTSYAVLSCLAGAIFVFLILLFGNLLGKEGKEKAFFLLILVTMGANQLFFGYIESYSFMYVALTGYILFGIRYLKRGSGFFAPALFLLLAISLHLSALFVLPSLFYLAFVSVSPPLKQTTRRFKFTEMVILICVIFMVGAGLYFLKISFSEQPSGSFLIYPFGDGERSYSFFSWAHLLDFLNLQLLVSPVSPVLWLVPLLLFWKTINFKGNTIRFLGWVILGSFCFALLVDPKLGYARDWDLFAFSGLGATLLGSYLWVGLSGEQQKIEHTGEESKMSLSRATVILFTLSLTFTLPWVLVNASEKKAIDRLEDLLKMDEQRAAYGYETLAAYFRDKGEFEKTVDYWKNAIAINPIPRYYAALGNAYRMVGQYDLAIEAFKRSIQMAPDRPYVELVHRSLGMCLAEAGRFDEAISHLKKAISLKPNKAIYYYTLGKTLGRAGRYQQAVSYLERTIKLDPNNIEAYKVLGMTYARVGRMKEAKACLTTYLKSMPQDAPWMKGIIDSIEIQIENGR